jgi:hypothetical protein
VDTRTYGAPSTTTLSKRAAWGVISNVALRASWEVARTALPEANAGADESASEKIAMRRSRLGTGRISGFPFVRESTDGLDPAL